MSRQHAAPLLLGESGATPLVPLPLGAGPGQISEAELQALVQAHPRLLPIAEIDPLFADPVPVCIELNTPAGPIDNLLVTASGLPVLVECKLWRNPEGRREVVGQILDYAKELSRWTASDLQREVSRRTGRVGNAVLELVRAAGHDVDEVAFNDALTLNLRRGRFLLLIVGDGIREGVEAIAEYLQAHAGLHFTLGLVELPIFTLPDGAKLVAPRVLARTELITRTVVAAPLGHIVQDDLEDIAPGPRGRRRPPAASTDVPPVDGAPHSIDPTELRRPETVEFWSEFLAGLRLDDPDQPLARPSGAGHIKFSMPAPEGAVWLTAFRSKGHNRLGLFLTHSRNGTARRVVQSILDDGAVIEELEQEVGYSSSSSLRTWEEDGRLGLGTSCDFDDLNDPEMREVAFEWLRDHVNRWVNLLRPRVKAVGAELAQR